MLRMQALHGWNDAPLLCLCGGRVSTGGECPYYWVLWILKMQACMIADENDAWHGLTLVLLLLCRAGGECLCLSSRMQDCSC
jgi:hypothetical protein